METALIMPALSGLLLMIAMAQFAWVRMERARRRQSELNHVKELLPRHYDALDRVNAAEGLPREMKEVVSWVSSGIEDEATAAFFVETVFDRHGGHFRRLEKDAEIVALRSAHPQAMEDYDLAMSTGILASVLSWPATARQAERIMAEVLTSPHEETAAAFRLAKRNRGAARSTLAGAF